MTDYLVNPPTQVYNSTSRVTKSVVFTGAASHGAVGTIPVFIPGSGGQAYGLVRAIFGYCSIDVDTAVGGGTIALGITGQTGLFVAATAATLVVAGKHWVTTTPTAGIAIPAACKDILTPVSAGGIAVTIAGFAVADGQIDFTLIFDGQYNTTMVAA